ncbi:hypothetical protein [Staphylococcus warneri]|uniref:hypothetical protein n=1 Tax=Staphylococcus warneri TaxID=1292 RepID=UPI001F53FAF4|nr:hypothetical protein [Staphylococcus warneri]
MTSKDMCLNEAITYMKCSFFNDNIETFGEITLNKQFKNSSNYLMVRMEVIKWK